MSFLDCEEGVASNCSSTAEGNDPAALSIPAGLPPTGTAAASSTGSNSYSGSGLSSQGDSDSGNNSRAGASSQVSSGPGALSALSRRGSTFGIAEQERAYAQRNSLEAAQRGAAPFEVSASGGPVQDSSGNGESPRGVWHLHMLKF